jgi:SPP1 family predicted phage head-tail adaptor
VDNLRAGNLRHRVAIQEQTEIPDGMGGSSITWSAKTGLGSVPAAIWPLSSKEQLDAMKLESLATNRIRIRYRPGITSKNRIVFGSRVFNILGAPINLDERGRQLDFIVSEQI